MQHQESYAQFALKDSVPSCKWYLTDSSQQETNYWKRNLYFWLRNNVFKFVLPISVVRTLSFSPHAGTIT